MTLRYINSVIDIDIKNKCHPTILQSIVVQPGWTEPVQIHRRKQSFIVSVSVLVPKMLYYVSSGTLNSTHSPPSFWYLMANYKSS